MPTITGTSGNDTLNGTSDQDEIFGLEGDDTINGGDGPTDSPFFDDFLHGGAGNDVIQGGTGFDLIWDDEGNDTVVAGEGDDMIFSSAGDDYYDGGVGGFTGIDQVIYQSALAGIIVDLNLSSGHVRSNGGADAAGIGIDTLANIEAVGGTSFDDIMTAGVAGIDFFGGGGNDQLYGGSGGDLLAGGTGNDILNGGAGIDVASYQGAAAGVTVSLAVTDAQNTGEGFDTLTGIEQLVGSAYGDQLTGDLGNNYLEGMQGNDELHGGAGNDYLSDFEGNDWLYGDGGSDTLDAGSGDDYLDGGAGADKLWGGDGNDRYFVDDAGDQVVEAAGEGDRDSVDAYVTYILPPNVEHLALHGAISGTGNALENHIVGDDSTNLINGAGGNDQLWGGGGNDSINGDEGNDVLDGQDGNDVMSGGAGDDFFRGGAGTDTMQGGLGNDAYELLAGDLGDLILEDSDGGYDFVFSDINFALPNNVEYLRLYGTEATTSGWGNDLNNSLVGNQFANSLFGLHGDDWLNGLGGDDILAGNEGADLFSGGDGADTLIGGAGADTMSGDAGADIFLDSAGNLNGDTIADLGAGDKIVIDDANLASFTFSLSGNTLTYTGGSLTLTGFTGRLQMSAAAGGGVQLTAVLVDSRSDFNGDGFSDVLWRRDSGLMTNWLGQANGGFSYNDANARHDVSTDWQIAGIGDFNGDDRADILWRRDNGQMTNWLGQDNGGFSYNDANAWHDVSTDWQVAGVGDFNGDNRDDILWRRDNGQMTNWLGQANGGFTYNDANALNQIATDWQIAGVGDFNGDGYDDILWRRDSGLMTNWLGQANGGFIYNDANARNDVSTDWHIAGVGDFNGDNRDDILWRRDNGQLTNWLGQINGSFISNDANALNQIATDWQIAAIGDFDGDNYDDILWRNDSGQMTNWLGQISGNFTYNDANARNLIATDWHIQAPDILLV